MSYIGILIQIKPQIKVCISLQRLTLKEQTNVKMFYSHSNISDYIFTQF